MLQKLAYFAVVVVLILLLILAGLTMSPGLDAAFHCLIDLFGGGRRRGRSTSSPRR